MDSLKDIFLKDIVQQIFPEHAPPESPYWTFLYRFDPDLFHLRHTKIGERVSEIVGRDAVSGFGMSLKQVIERIYRTYQNELERDGFIKENLLGGGPGRSRTSPWLIAYEWLWKHKYSRWQEVYIWESWKQVASRYLGWIQFQKKKNDIPRGLVIPKSPINKNLPMNTSLNLKIELNHSGGYFLLFNRGLENQGTITKYLVIPSQAFAPSPLLEETILIPQEDAICEDIKFDAVGKEEYIGILVDEDLDLPWLNPDPEHPVLEWQGKHLGEVWEHLQHQDNWQVFYRDFEIVSPDG